METENYKGITKKIYNQDFKGKFCMRFQCLYLCFNSLKYAAKVNVQYEKKKKNTLIYFNTNYCIEMKLVPIIMDYCLLQFDDLKFFLEVRLHRGRSLPNFNLFNVNFRIFQRNRKVHLSKSL